MSHFVSLTAPLSVTLVLVVQDLGYSVLEGQLSRRTEERFATALVPVKNSENEVRVLSCPQYFLSRCLLG